MRDWKSTLSPPFPSHRLYVFKTNKTKQSVSGTLPSLAKQKSHYLFPWEPLKTPKQCSSPREIEFAHTPPTLPQPVRVSLGGLGVYAIGEDETGAR